MRACMHIACLQGCQGGPGLLLANQPALRRLLGASICGLTMEHRGQHCRHASCLRCTISLFRCVLQLLSSMHAVLNRLRGTCRTQHSLPPGSQRMRQPWPVLANPPCSRRCACAMTCLRCRRTCSSASPRSWLDPDRVQHTVTEGIVCMRAVWEGRR